MSILIVLAATFLGAVAGLLAARRFRRTKPVIGPLVLLAALTAVATNATQRLLDAGVPFTAVDVLEALFYFLFAFSAAAAWKLIAPSGVRWLLLLLMPIALFEPLRWAFWFALLSLKRLGL